MESHYRICRDCGNTAQHDSDITPGVLCKKCGSQDTRKVVGRSEDIRRVLSAFRDLESKMSYLNKIVSELDEVERFINSYSDRVDISGYTLLSKITRIAQFVKDGSYAIKKQGNES